ncbi:MAG: manganese-binding transcriptional regulator MntR [Opitutaceae bacterium]|jgi:DtxR family manganese transport transcriptional regulator
MKRPLAKAAKARAPLQTINLQRTRAEHAQETAQDYVELVAELIATKGAARVTDIAQRMGITHVTVNRTIQRLRRDGLVIAEPYRTIFLTDAGRKLSEESRKRHEIVSEFLESLGVPGEIADADAEGMEHHASKETLEAFSRILKQRKKSGGLAQAAVNPGK